MRARPTTDRGFGLAQTAEPARVFVELPRSVEDALVELLATALLAEMRGPVPTTGETPGGVDRE